MNSPLHIIFLTILCNSAFAQTPAFIHYETGNGLPSNEVYEMKQDSKGFLWIGCEAGLVRYDGNRFALLHSKRNRGTTISNLREDKNGKIWCINFSGQVFSTNKDSLKLFEPWEKNYKSGFAEIAIDNNDNLYISNQQNSIYKYELRSGKETIAVNDNLYKCSPFTATDGSVLFTLLDSGNVKKITDHGVVTVTRQLVKQQSAWRFVLNNIVFYNSFFNRQTLAFQRYNPGDKKPWLYYYRNTTLVEHPASAILQQLNIYPLSAFYDDAGNLFIGSSNELLWLKQTGDNGWQLFKRLLPGNSISYICKDRESNIWISTLKNGIYKLPNINMWNLSLPETNGEITGINHLAGDGKGTLFVASLNGKVFSYDKARGAYKLLDVTEKRDVQAMQYNPYNQSLYISRGKTVMIGWPLHPTSVFLDQVANCKDFFFRKDGAVFFTGNELSVFAGKDKQLLEKLKAEFTPIYLPYFGPADTVQRIIFSVQRCKPVWYDEKEKILWAGFVDGVTGYQDRQTIQLKDPATNRPVIAAAFTEGPDGKLLIATVEQGIYVLQHKKIIAQYTVSNGLLSDRVKTMRYAAGKLWIICGTGIQSIDLITGTVNSITTKDGLLSNENYDIEIMQDTVYAASSKGIQYFPANINTRNEMAPVSMIGGFIADEQNLLPGGKIALDYNTRNIAISLQGIALKSDGSFIYQYRLLPSDTSWISVSANENIIRFSSLSPGRYTFQSRVLNEDGVMSTTISEQQFSISKPWWLQWWFLVLVGVIFISGSYLLFRNRIRATQKKNEEQLERSKVQEQLRSSQLSSLKAQMNPHFMFNALNSIQEFILLNDKRQANMYMGKFADLMRMTLDMSNKEKISLEEEVRVLELYLQLEGLRFEEGFTSSLTIAADITPENIFLPAMLIQPNIENAIKHGLLHKHGNKQLDVHFSVTGHTLLCTITDNGIGRKRSNEINAQRQRKHTSFATGATQKRLQLLNHDRKEPIGVVYEDLHDNHGNASGTKVAITIPL